MPTLHRRLSPSTLRVLPRRSGAVMAGLIATAALATPMAGTAQAADPEVQIIQKVDSPAGPLTRETALTASHNSNGFVSTKTRHVNGVAATQRWIKREVAPNYFTFKNVHWQQCLTAVNNISGSNLKLQPCTFGNDGRQMWTPGLSGAARHKLQNLQSGYVATLKQSLSVPNNTTGDVVQAFDQGLNRQKWSFVTPF
jgi:hypothetical protein